MKPMAIKTMAQIGREIAARFAIGRIAMVHRLGRIEIGETSVAVVVTAPHRRPAFDAALEGINRLKRLVPVWKKEYFVGWRSLGGWRMGRNCGESSRMRLPLGSPALRAGALWRGGRPQLAAAATPRHSSRREAWSACW